MSVMPHFSNDEEMSPQNQDVLLQIASLIRLAESFRLGFVKCNQPIQSRLMTARLKEMLGDEAIIIIVELTESVVSLRRAVLQALELAEQDILGKRAILVLGFERSIPSEGPAPALDELNQSRDNFPKSFSGPVLIWLPDYALTRLAREAPDFWGWRSGVFEFSPEQKMMDLVEKTLMQSEEEERLSLAEKRVLASALDCLIMDYNELPRGEREDRALAAVLQRLGDIRYLLGDYDEAHKLYQQSLEIAQELGDKSGVSKSLHNLGRLAYLTGDYGEARRLYQQSLEIAQELGDKRGVSKSLHNLGILSQETGNYDEARKLYQQSLEIAQELGDKRGVSRSQHELGMLAQDIGDYKEARKLYQQSLEISQELGYKRGVLRSQHQLGMLAQDIGDYEEARKLYQQSLEISQELGDKSGVSKTLHNLGSLAYLTGDYDEARKLYQQSLEIKQKLGDKSGLARTLAMSSILEEMDSHLDKAMEQITEAEILFLELHSPMAAQARRVREMLKRKQGKS